MLKAFPPVAAPDARVLILGSMPGVASLRAARYYAHPRNAFWPVMAALTGVPAQAPYTERLAGLMRSGIALWDVLHACEREGSLDAAIVDATSVPNDFAAFFREHPGVKAVFFNGAKAEQSFRRQVLGRQAIPEGLALMRLPSTSPAHAGMALERKQAVWREALLLEAGVDMCPV
jgi:TDG/mug DNA glycosylase family protein